MNPTPIRQLSHSMETLREYMAQCLSSERNEAEEDCNALIHELMLCSEELHRLGNEKDAEITLLAAFFCGRQHVHQHQQQHGDGMNLPSSSFRGNRFILTIVSRMVHNLKISPKALLTEEILV